MTTLSRDRQSYKMGTQTQKLLMYWYSENKRQLPWRINRDPYRVWISEVMLQQTTVVAVIPYYEKFLARFQTLQDLAQADESEVLKYWSGLGYYSRARNLHKAAQILAQKNFAKSASELLEIPGFGPYTSRAVSSICFDEKVGVLDGNVIRVLCRFLGLNWEWWRPQERKRLQQIADQFAQVKQASIWNQAMMELGASICTPKKPACLICPINESCQSFKKNLSAHLPRAKPRPKKEIWIWHAHVIKNKNKVLLVKNNYAPFLKNQWLPPGKAVCEKVPPKRYHFKHMITHHEIYVVGGKKKKLSQAASECEQRWVEIDRLSEISPTSLVAKLIASGESS